MTKQAYLEIKYFSIVMMGKFDDDKKYNFPDLLSNKQYLLDNVCQGIYKR